MAQTILFPIEGLIWQTIRSGIAVGSIGARDNASKGKTTSKVVHQFIDGDFRLFQNRLQRFWFDLSVHRHARMQTVFLVMAMGTRLPDKFKAQAFRCPAHLIPGKVAGKFHAS